MEAPFLPSVSAGLFWCLVFRSVMPRLGWFGGVPMIRIVEVRPVPLRIAAVASGARSPAHSRLRVRYEVAGREARAFFGVSFLIRALLSVRKGVLLCRHDPRPHHSIPVAFAAVTAFGDADQDLGVVGRWHYSPIPVMPRNAGLGPNFFFRQAYAFTHWDAPLPSVALECMTIERLTAAPGGDCGRSSRSRC
jgi:hypothetical protein